MMLQIPTLRQYQQQAYQFRKDRQDESVVLQLPTGTGKTAIICTELMDNISMGRKSLVISPRKELVKMITEKMERFATSLYSGVKPDLSCPVLVTTARSAIKAYHLYKPSRVLVDECHSNSYDIQVRLSNKYKTILTGYTATPNRLDGQGLYKIYKSMYISPPVQWFIDNNYLSPFEIQTSDILDFSETSDSLDVQSNKLMPHVADTVKLWIEHARERRTVVFCPTIAHAKKMCDEFITQGFDAAIVSHQSSDVDRESHFQNFKSGKLQILINVELLTMGVDVPDCDCVLLARFTYSTALYLQMVGRCLRYLPYKLATILDVVNNVFYHGAPSLGFDWSLEGEKIKLTSNQSSLYHYCTNEDCAKVLAHIKHVIFPTPVSCLSCHQESWLTPRNNSVSKGVIHKVFSVEDLHQLTDLEQTEISRILRSSKMKKTKKQDMIIALNVKSELKRKALKQLGLDDKIIDFYLED